MPVHFAVAADPEDFSTFYDLNRLYFESHIAAIEMSAFKMMRPTFLTDGIAPNEKMSCWSLREQVTGSIDPDGWSLLLHGIKMSLWALPKLQRGSDGGRINYDAIKYFDANEPERHYWIHRCRSEFLPQRPILSTTTSVVDPLFNLKPGFTPHLVAPPSDQVLCLDNTLFLSPILLPETFPTSTLPLEPLIEGEDTAWEEVGQYAHFSSQVEAQADQYLLHLFNVTSLNQIPPFITIHLRRGDFKAFTGLTALDFYIKALERVRERLQKRINAPESWRGPSRKEFKTFEGYEAKDYAIVATSDETSGTEFMLAVKALGWKVIDHDEQRTDEVLGGWWSAILDSAILARGQSFVGTPKSTYTGLAALRVK